MNSPRTRSTFLLGPALVWLSLLFLVPLFLVMAVSVAKRGAPFDWGWDFSGWQGVVSNERTMQVFWRAIGYALGTTGIALLLGFPLTWFIVRRPPGLQRVLYALVLVPLIANSLMLCYAWKILLNEQGLVGRALVALHVGEPETGIANTQWASLVGMIYYHLPFMVYPLYASLEKFDWKLLEASADLGAGKWQTFRHVTLPLVWPGMGTGCCMVFIQAVGTYYIPDILGGGKELFLGTLIYNRFIGKRPNWPEGAALSLLTMAAILVGLVVYFWVQRRMDRNESKS